MGSTRVVFDGSGGVYSYSNYEPFGKAVDGVGSNDRLSFIGKEKDDESDLGDFGVRKYDNEIGRFLSTDPLWENYRAYTPYNYCGNNPLLLKDPTGTEWYYEAEEYKEQEKYIDKDGIERTREVIKTRMVWKWYDNTPEKNVWKGEYDKDGNKIYEIVKGKNDFQLYLDVLIDNVAEQFGLKDIAALVSGLSGLNVLPTRAKFGGATKGTSVASKYLSKLLPYELPFRVKVPTGKPKIFGGKGIKLALTKILGRVLGRAVPILGWAILAYDTAAALYKTQTEFNSIVSKRK